MGYRQVIIARKDLGMSPGKLSAQVAHASMAFMTNEIRKRTVKVCINRYHSSENDGSVILYRHPDLYQMATEANEIGEKYFYAEPVNHKNPFGKLIPSEPIYRYELNMNIPNGIMEEWIGGVFTKTVCEAKNKSQIMKAVKIAEDLGLKENVDFFLIKDCCLTELEPEEIDENGVGRVLTCIGFKPLPDDIAHQISKRFQLYK